jgi:hypothetical protein
MNNDELNRKLRMMSDLGFCIGLLEGLAITQDKNTREWLHVIIEKLVNVRKEVRGE